MQTNRRCNHVALVDRGWHGSEVRVKIDGAEQVDDAGTAQAIVSHLDALEADLAKAHVAVEQAKVKLN